MKRFIEKSKNRRLETSKKYDQVKQSQNQNVFEFVAYIKTLKYELKSFTETQKRNHLLNRLKSNINQMINESVDISRTRDALAARATRIDNARSKSFDQDDHETDSDQASQTINFSEKRFRNKRGGDSAVIITREFNNSTTRPRSDGQERSNINTQSLASDVNDASRMRTCYNCDEANYIARNCSKSSRISQVNAVVQNFRSSSQIDVRQTLFARLIIEIDEKLKN